MALNNFTSLNSGLASGINGSFIPQTPVHDYIIYPQSIGNSSAMPEQVFPSAKTLQPTWQETSNVALGYEVTDILQWAITFPSNNGDVPTAIYRGNPVVVFDCPRTAYITLSNASDWEGTVTINGYDVYLNEVVENINYNSGTVLITGLRAFYIITSLYFNISPWTTSSTSNTVTVRGSNIFGLPYFVNATDSVYMVNWDSAVITPTITPGYFWRWDGTNDPYFQEDARGTVDLSLEDYTPDGLTPLHVQFYAYGYDQQVNTQLGNLLSQPSGGIAYNFNPNNTVGSSAATVYPDAGGVGSASTLPRLVDQDRFGVQFPSDLAFIGYYKTLWNV